MWLTRREMRNAYGIQTWKPSEDVTFKTDSEVEVAIKMDLKELTSMRGG
jgi:hypothetical protein